MRFVETSSASGVFSNSLFGGVVSLLILGSVSVREGKVI